jgi:siroheme synthase-like protein
VPELADREDIERTARGYGSDCLGDAELVFVCTDSAAINTLVAGDARQRGVWCNVADHAQVSDFLVPAVLRRGSLTVAVGTEGTSPYLAAHVRDKLAEVVGQEYADLLEELAEARRRVLGQVPDEERRRRIFDTLCADHSLKLLAGGDRQAWRDWFERLVQHETTETNAPHSEEGNL